MKPGALRCAPAALPGDQFEGGIVLDDSTHQQRLQHALFADRLGERLELGLAKASARLQTPGPDQLDRNPPLSVWVRCRIGLAEQSGKAAAERAPLDPIAHCGMPGAARR